MEGLKIGDIVLILPPINGYSLFANINFLIAKVICIEINKRVGKEFARVEISNSKYYQYTLYTDRLLKIGGNY